jgi:hypothetical protein
MAELGPELGPCSLLSCQIRGVAWDAVPEP